MNSIQKKMLMSVLVKPDTLMGLTDIMVIRIDDTFEEDILKVIDIDRRGLGGHRIKKYATVFWKF